MTDWIEEGQEAPNFTLKTDEGEEIELQELRGRPVVLYFYPKDDTPGCTKEACAFRDRKEELAERGALVLGVSPDGVESHASFREKYDLNFPLLADTDHRVAERYGAWREKNLYGKTREGIQRSTFVIDEEGIVRKRWSRVRVDGHDERVLEALEELDRERKG
ncbi:MAG: thioredoxin-dependent thiol peroxidase [Thermoanaerobaculia bacterium]|nr:thioredoxin-dependent thiol peroxidase [Thermoanaerobaculia bacterium]